jgi:hypothetical protein
MYNTTDLIVVKQLPEIAERLAVIKTAILEKVEGVLALECTESTVKAIKGLRADLNKDFGSFEERRRTVKAAVMKPYEDFEAVYRDCVTSIFESADEQLRSRIAEVEDDLKEQKRLEVEAYFGEYAQSRGIDFIAFEHSGIAVTLSVSAKKLKEAAKAFLDRIVEDLALIDTQEHKEEILVEYKRTLNVSSAITRVSERRNAILAERARRERMAQVRMTEEKAVGRVDEALSAAAEVPANIPAAETEEPIYKLTFSVWGTKEQLRAIKQFLTQGGYRYE